MRTGQTVARMRIKLGWLVIRESHFDLASRSEKLDS